MIPSLHDVKDFKIFAAFKMDDNYEIVALPQPLSIQYETSYVRLRKEYIIEWEQDINEKIYPNRSEFLILYQYNVFDKKIDTKILHAFAIDYSTCSCTDTSIVTIRYKTRYAVTSILTPDEKMVVDTLNNRFTKRINKLRGDDINIITVDELNESDNMNDTFATSCNAVFGLSIIAMPKIVDIYYNAPHTTVKWSDGTTTTVTATSGEEFNKEIGLAMAISRKYCECIGYMRPRAGFKRMVNNAHDQTAKTAARKAYKNSKKLLKAADISNEESEDRGLDSNS